MPPHVFAVAQRAYWRMLMQQQDQAIVPLGRSNAGKTSCCQNTLEYLVATAGSIDDRVTGKSLCVAGRHGLTERGGGGGDQN